MRWVDWVGPGYTKPPPEVGPLNVLQAYTGVRAWGPGTVPLQFVPCGVLCAAGVAGIFPGGDDFSPL